MCWLLHDVYNKRRRSKFILSGTDGAFLPWLPPPGLPHSILEELREALHESCKVFPPASKPSPSRIIRLTGDIDTFILLKSSYGCKRSADAL